MLRAIKREVLPDVLRVTLELDHETIFKDDRIDGPPRVFVDLQNTRAGTPIQDARLGYDDDVVRQIRVGRQLDRRIRDLDGQKLMPMPDLSRFDATFKPIAES